jgi:hypothetical protein
MAGSHWNLRRVAARAALAGLAAFAAVSGANAQWFPPMGAASPGEIAQRLRAQGFVLTGPLRRNETVYLADVDAGASGHERLVIDAWSGEVLQRFVARPRTRSPGAPGGYVIERGEFDSPPPLGPPPARDFFFGSGGGGGVAYGGPPGAPVEATPRTRVNPRPAPIRRKPAESKPAVTAAPPVQPAAPPEGGANAAAKDNNPSGIALPNAAAAPTGAPSPGGQASQTGAPATFDASPAESPPAAAPDQVKQTQKPEGAAASPNVAQTQAKGEPQPARIEPPAAAPLAPATKPGGKPKVNDVPVNPLE